MGRARLTDIAREAGVSSATVDRVLNDRPGVRARTRDAVRTAAARLGYIDGAESPAQPIVPVCRLEMVLPAGTNSFMRELARHIEQLSALHPEARVTIHSIEGFDPDSLAAKLAEFGAPDQGVAVVAIDHPTVREAMRALALRGSAVITLVSDIHHVPRAGYVGIDNRSAGRLAGYLVGRLLGPGHHRVALFAGSLSYRGHEEREMGFRHVLAEDFPTIGILDSTEVRDDDSRAHAAAMAMFEAHPDVDAIYNIGAGNRGIARALEETGRARRVIFVGHDLTEHTKGFLLNRTMDVVIDQNPRVQAREALAQLVRSVKGEPWSALAVRVQAIFRENIPEL
ncbi:LacI family DNA-binding transcriptional regulator [Pelagibacterium montanilacus]|uniref:LacI family DNA-binding transcriptional regulator n=1 Tax=Pelagibacterium montanilacus TaxID=2185280 RepID=UPI000F8DFE00|nr:LacI family DNA-binding transcriptional regulator [Pelagibacterium montanilacus]